MDITALRAHAHQILRDASIPELPNHYHGKVRENYDLADGTRILIATDRLSAFDRILAAIPLKGQVLTQTARYWFTETADLCPNHVLATPDPNVVIGQRLDILPVEIVVRDYLAGTTSIRFPDGMRPNQRLDHPIITPTTKAFDGAHDAPLSAAEILATGLLTAPQWSALCEYALALFARGQQRAAARGLILADTKYEFGLDPAGRIVLADEIHTPDSSRYWFASTYTQHFETGTAPQSFDKDFVRSWVVARCDPYKDPVPEIPAEIVLDTARVYIEAYETITGENFAFPGTDEAPLDRIRRALAPYMNV
jgi:phosphoribosylaminoimidazole-succinocarboxamide synthase